MGRPAELLDRFLARLIDHVLLLVVNFVIVSIFVVGSLMNGSGGMFGGGSNFLTNVVGSVLGAAIYLATSPTWSPAAGRPSARWWSSSRPAVRTAAARRWRRPSSATSGSP
ncbi:RDD family protein [Ornithinimicrobium sp. CNJ-824]|uniref:RDD family protein n=1 Tax=Ornithinimicrobium sp. CNJ-824 TaxID=1904966 RepID=UPI00192CFB4A|nr:RDD family protein [Ornithinimicrobium sp. CNJ-824]